MATKVPIKYTSRDFESIKQDLLDYAKRYYPDTYKDFSEASFGSLMVDTVSYVGDILSFYVDYNVNETFLTTATERKNIIKLARQNGYKLPAKPSAYGTVNLYVTIPASTTARGPDTKYIPILKQGTQFNSTLNQSFTLLDDVDFNSSNAQTVVFSVDATTGLPTKYAIKTQGTVVSGRQSSETVTVGEYQKFLRVDLVQENISEILSVFDSEGHEYYEVEHLSQDIIYKLIPNPSFADDGVPSLIKPFPVPRRFVLERNNNGTVSLQFGYGSETSITEEPIVDPSQIILQKHSKPFITDTTFDPYDLITNDKLGVAPSSTILTINYRINNSVTNNSPSNSITNISLINVQFNDNNLDANKRSSVVSSMRVQNVEPITGDLTDPTSEELKVRAISFYTSQNRAVTSNDYINLLYNMPTKLGSIKRAVLYNDPDSAKRNLNIYVISQDLFGNLVQTNSTIKNNVKVWLNNNKMVNDTIDILDAKILNIGLEFVVLGDTTKNKVQILNDCIEALITKYTNKFDIGESFSISDVYYTLNKVDGVIDTVSVKPVLKTGGIYSDVFFDIKKRITPDGRYIRIPKNVIVEIKSFNADLKGTVR